MLIHSHTIHTINVYRAGERAHAAREREGEREPERDIRERVCVWGVGGAGPPGGKIPVVPQRPVLRHLLYTVPAETNKQAKEQINTSSHFGVHACVRACVRACVGWVRACVPYPRTMAKTASYPPAPGTPPPNTPGIAAVESSNRV
jgi:hypothetical protein